MSAATSSSTVPGPALLNPYLSSVNGHGGRSGPPSRSSSSSMIMTRNSSYAPSLTSLPQQPQHEHHNKLSSRLRHMFDTQKYAVFNATVTVHELGNVPQLRGEFAVRWKFRGKRPKGKEVLEMQKAERALVPKPSLPNLKMTHGVPAMQHSTSSASIRSFSTTSSAAAPTTPRTSPVKPLSRKAFTQPPVGASPDRPGKRPTDPTPLKHVIAPSDDDQDQGLPTESPKDLVDEPEEEPELVRRSLDNTRNDSHGSSGSSGSDNSIGPQILVHRPSVRNGASTAMSSRNTSVSSNISQNPSIRDFPLPRTPSQYPPVRSGTTPSFQALVEPLRGLDDGATPVRRPLSRTVSMATTATSSSASGSAYTPRPHLGRTRSSSGPGGSSSGLPTEHSSGSRQGTTPTRPLRSHTCQWDYELQHVIRIPLGKPVPPSSAATPNGAFPFRQQASGPAFPLLGAGPHSESGLKLIIDQLPTSGAVSSAPAAGANDHSLSSIVAAAHHAHHVDKKDTNPSEGSKGKNAQKEKTVFGVVDLDLAMFAGRGRNTRRFLLKGSRTNATIKVTVDMKWIGGEEKWTAPPMQEGHHITGVSDLVGTEAQDTLRNDLYLHRTPSNSSSSSSLGLGRVQTNVSAGSSVYPSRNASLPNVNVAPIHNYKTYEHHLRKPDTASSTNSSPSKGLHRVPEPGDSPERKGGLATSLMIDTESDKLGPMHASGPSPLVLSLSSMNNHHRHHTHHIRRHQTESRSGIHDLPPELIIEAIFNPHPSSEAGPFTYVPEEQNTEDLEGTDEVLEGMIDDVDDREDQHNTRGHRWRRGKHDEGGNGNGSKLKWRARARAKTERKEKEKEKEKGPDKDKEKVTNRRERGSSAST